MAARRGGARRVGCLLGALAAVLVVVLAIGWWLGSGLGSDHGGEPAPTPTPGPGETTAPTTQAEAQPADCPDVELLAVPGTWESTPTDDPSHPSFQPAALLTTVTAPLQQKYGDDRLKVYTVPYTAQFRNPQRPAEVTYDASRAEGTDKLRGELTATHSHCPQTRYVLTGFSQGAVIAGDVTAQIGTGTGPVPADRVLGSVLIADGRRQPGVGQSPGVSPGNGQGMEIALQPATGVTQMIAGATMTGARPGGFGALQDRTAQICDSRDLICDAPLGVVDGAARFQQFLTDNAIHAQYATNPDVIPGTTVPAWTVQHVTGLVDGAPRPAHH